MSGHRRLHRPTWAKFLSTAGHGDLLVKPRPGLGVDLGGLVVGEPGLVEGLLQDPIPEGGDGLVSRAHT